MEGQGLLRGSSHRYMEQAMNTQPEALRLAEIIGGDCAAELRRLYDVNQELLAALQDSLDLIEMISPIEGQTVRKARAAIAKAEAK